MLNARTLIIYAILGLLNFVPLEGSWRTLPPPNDKADFHIKKVISRSNFWVATSNGHLYQYDSQWSAFEPPQRGGIYYNFIIPGQNDIIAAVVDSAFHTHFYRRMSQQWERMDLVATVPVRRLESDATGNIYAYGDWGRIFQINEAGWKRIPTPFENHITAMEVTTDSLQWFAVRNEGIYQWDGERFNSIPVPESVNYDILQIIESENGGVYFLAIDGKIYKFDEAGFVLADSTLPAKPDINIYSYSYMQSIILYNHNTLYWYNHDGWQIEPLPTKRELLSARILPDGSKILTTNHGKLFIQEPDPKLYFIEQAAERYVEGNLLDNSDGAAFLDFNSDSYLDLFITNHGENQFNRMYLNTPEGLYTEISTETGLSTISNIQTFAFEDFDRNGTLDFGCNTTSASEEVFELHQNTGAHQYQPYARLMIPFSVAENVVDLEWAPFQQSYYPRLFTLFYYSNGKNPGTSHFINNTIWGKVRLEDTSDTILPSGWHRDVTFADLNQDNISDLSLANYWQSNRIFLSAGKTGWREYDFFHRIDSTETKSQGTIAVDYDVDGDLDIIEQSLEFGIRVLQNNSETGQFIHRQIIDDNVLASGVINTVNSGDLDNNGFPDLIVTSKSGEEYRVHILLNQFGQKFESASYDIGVNKARVTGVIVGDIDNDGDLDLYGIENGTNKLWVNQLNTANFVQVRVQPGRSLLSGRGTKIWIYDSGYLGEITHLRGFQQLGANNFKNNLHNSPVSHFGLGSLKSVDIQVRFPSGITRTRTSVSAGSRVSVAEHNPVMSALVLLPGKLILILRNQSFYLYGLILLFAFGITYYGINIGVKYFNWEMQLATVLVIINFTLFWILLMIFQDQSWVFRYIIPLGTVVGGYALPLGFSYQMKTRERDLSQEEAEDKLFSLLRQFSHGEWAMSTLNSLHLLSRNAGKNPSPKIIRQIQVRGETFEASIQEILGQIVNTADKANYNAEFLDDFREALSNLGEDIAKIRESDQGKPIPANLSDNTGQLIDSLRELKHQMFRKYSSDVEKVVRQVTEAMEPHLNENGVTLTRYKEEQKTYCALVPEFVLADIIDNCIANSIRALETEENKKIEIMIFRRAPKIGIKVKDNGTGIPQELHERVFESGYSNFNSTGEGLYQARENLKKYGGRIEVKPQKSKKGATIVIELNEGIQS